MRLNPLLPIRDKSEDATPGMAVALQGVQARTGEPGVFVVLIKRDGIVLNMDAGRVSEIADVLHDAIGLEEFLVIDSGRNPEVFRTLGVEPSTPKLLMFQKGQLVPPVWLVDPERPDVGSWLAALEKAGVELP